MTTEEILQAGIDILILTANGGLAILYWLWHHALAVLAWPIAGAVMVFLEAPAHATGKVRRYDDRQVRRFSLASHLSTVLLLAVWTFVAFSLPLPIPAIGLCFWLTFFVVPLGIPEERDELTATLRWFVWGYTLLCLVFYLFLSVQLSPQALLAWGQLVGQQGGGEAMQTNVVSWAVPWATLILWVLYPASTAVYVFSRIKMHRRSVRNPAATIKTRLLELRTRSRRQGFAETALTNILQTLFGVDIPGEAD